MAASVASSIFPHPVWIVGFAGHRPHKTAVHRSDEALQATAGPIRDALRALNERAKESGGELAFATSLAAGADIVAAEIAVELGLSLHLFLPLSVAEFADDFAETPTWWPRAQALLTRAGDPVHGGTVRIIEGAQCRPDCYYDTGAQIVEAADAMLIVWDGQPAEGIGGTADIVERVRAQKAPLLNSDTQTEYFEWKPIPFGLLAPGAAAFQWEDLELFATRRDAGLAWTTATARALDKYRQRGTAVPGDTNALFKAFDDGAIAAARETRATLMSSILMHGAAALLAATTAVFFAPALVANVHEKNLPRITLTSLELLLVALAGLGIWRLHRRHTQSVWLQLRHAAEIVRSLRAAGRLLDPLFPLVARHLPGWRRLSISVALAVWREQAAAPLAAARNAYLENRIRHQIDHYQSMLRRAAPAHRIAQAFSRWCSGLAIPFVLFALLSKIFHWGHIAATYHLTKPHDFATLWLPIALPLAAGIASALQSALDSGRRSRTYAEMVERLNAFQSAIATVKTESALRRLVGQAEEVLIDEQVEWRTATTISQH